MVQNTDSEMTGSSGLLGASRNGRSSINRRGRPSSTAIGSLRWRAIEGLRPEDERVCYDNLAIDFMGLPWSRFTRNRLVRRLLIRQSDKDYIGIGGFTVARTRYIDELLKSQIAEGIKQLVIMGAGYDSRAYRFSELQQGGVKVFEVDQPDTQVLKMTRVATLLGSLPKHVVYVHVDLDTEKLEVNLVKNGYNRNLNTLFIWEGVMMYLTAESIDRTLSFIADNSGDGTCVVFDYLYESAVDGSSGLKEAEMMRKKCARLGEPLIFGLKEDAVGEFLSRRGFSLVQNITAKSLKETYFKGKGQQRKVLPLGAVACAGVRHRT